MESLKCPAHCARSNAGSRCTCTSASCSRFSCCSLASCWACSIITRPRRSSCRAANKLFNRIEQDVRLDLRATYQPIRHLLSLLADNPATQAAAP